MTTKKTQIDDDKTTTTAKPKKTRFCVYKMKLPEIFISIFHINKSKINGLKHRNREMHVFKSKPNKSGNSSTPNAMNQSQIIFHKNLFDHAALVHSVCCSCNIIIIIIMLGIPFRNRIEFYASLCMKLKHAMYFREKDKTKTKKKRIDLFAEFGWVVGRKHHEISFSGPVHNQSKLGSCGVLCTQTAYITTCDCRAALEFFLSHSLSPRERRERKKIRVKIQNNKRNVSNLFHLI